MSTKKILRLDRRKDPKTLLRQRNIILCIWSSYPMSKQLLTTSKYPLKRNNRNETKDTRLPRYRWLCRQKIKKRLCNTRIHSTVVHSLFLFLSLKAAVVQVHEIICSFEIGVCSHSHSSEYSVYSHFASYARPILSKKKDPRDILPPSGECAYQLSIHKGRIGWANELDSNH